MPTRAEDLHAFDLMFLKALVNFKINRNYARGLSTKQKEDLCIQYNTDDGVVHLNPDYLKKIWKKEKEIPHSITLSTLDELCKIFHKDYSWYSFTDDIAKFRPMQIPYEVPYSLLRDDQRGVIDKAIENALVKYKRYEEFEQEVMSIVKVIEKGEIKTTIHSINSRNEENREVLTFLNNIYIELTTRKAAIQIDEDKDVIEEVYDSWHQLFCAIRGEMKNLPFSYLNDFGDPESITRLPMKILNEVLRPHLTEHQAKYRTWLENAKRNPKNKSITPQELQKEYPNYKDLIFSIKEVNKKLIVLSKEIYSVIHQT